MSVVVVLSGIVGSTAYGLAREGSDIDLLGVFRAHTLDVAGLDWHPSRETRVTRDPDTTLHELGKYLRLALTMNPTAIELLWLPDDLYETRTTLGYNLVAGRHWFLHERGVRNAYGGYARQQAVKLRNRGDSFSSDTRGRTVKHARHLLRLLRQGRHLLETGELVLRVDNPDDYWAFDDMTPDQMLAVYDREDALFHAARSVLPVDPDRASVAAFLRGARAAAVGVV